MIKRRGGYLQLQSDNDAPDACRAIERDGFAVVERVLSTEAVDALAEELSAVYTSYPRDRRADRPASVDEDFRYEMFNRSALAQETVAHPDILAVIDPLLGEDAHVIANTCWRNPPRAEPGHGGGFWHIDAGPHIPRDPAIEWDERIPYPIFAIGVHIYLKDCPRASGPTGVIPGSHKSGQPPPRARYDDMTLTYRERGVVPLTAKAGDVAFFASDVWHRRLPTLEGDRDRFFLQVHYGRRDIAQRIRPTASVNHLSAAALERIQSARERRLLGLHEPFFYDG